MKNSREQKIQEVISSVYDKLLSKKQKEQKVDVFDLNFCNVDCVIEEASKKNKKAIIITFESELDLRKLPYSREKNLKSLC
jgi:hypothetical protein